MILTFESDKQNIYALNGTKLSVGVGNSGFSGATSDVIMYYEWRLEWSEYMGASDTGGGTFTALFRMNTTSDDDLAFDTAGIDAARIQGRNNNDGTKNFCIRIANKGQKYLQPYYVNVTRR